MQCHAGLIYRLCCKTSLLPYHPSFSTEHVINMEMSRPNPNPNPNPNASPTLALTLKNRLSSHKDFNAVGKRCWKTVRARVGLGLGLGFGFGLGLDMPYQINFGLAKTVEWGHQTRKTLKSGCLSLLTIRSFGARDGLGLTVRVWLGFGLRVRLGLSILYQMPTRSSTIKSTSFHLYSRKEKTKLSDLTNVFSQQICMLILRGCWLSAASGEAKQRMKGKCSVNAIHLALYLYSQNVTRMQTQKFSLRSEEFPERKAKKKGIDVRFIETFLTDIIKIIGEPESKSLPLDKNHCIRDPVRHLDNEPSLDTTTTLTPTITHIPQRTCCPLMQSFSALQIRSWLLDHIHANPFTSKRCLMYGKAVYTKPGKLVTRRSIDNTDTLTRCRVMINDHETPDGHRMVAMQYVCRQILVLSPEVLLGHRVHVSHCNDASLYFLSSVMSVTAKQCSRSTLVTGPVAGTIYLTGCVNVRLITIARRVILRNCHGCKVYLATPSRPLLLGGCTDITLAPHNTFYSGLQGHMQYASFSLAVNKWDCAAVPPLNSDYNGI
eukprot:sb/3463631/